MLSGKGAGTCLQGREGRACSRRQSAQPPFSNQCRFSTGPKPHLLVACQKNRSRMICWMLLR